MKIYPAEIPALFDLKEQYGLTCSQIATAHKKRTGRTVSRETIRRSLIHWLECGDSPRKCGELPS